MSFYSWKPYVPVAKRRADTERAIKRLGKAGQIDPVRIQGRTIASSFWGKGWCTHLEKHSDFENRLPRGRTYVRNGSVCHLAVNAGRIEARVAGSQLYDVVIQIGALKPAAWQALKKKCAGQVGSLLELLQGELSSQVMSVVTDRDTGLFPQPGEMKFDCSCPDWADMCKHVAAVLYGVGNRLDRQPALLFQLRGVDASELIAESLNASGPATAPVANRLADDALGGIFGIEFDEGAPSAVAEPGPKSVPPRRRKKSAAPAKTPKPSPRGKGKPAPFRASAQSIGRLRKRLGFSVAEFARQLEVSPASVSRWEAERGPLKLQARCLAALDEIYQTAE
ncbi:MAG: SWIM zinc finger family protein [Nevskia sp.]|nr:SWIM zinc finger family protein [Nevskia sp.]